MLTDDQKEKLHEFYSGGQLFHHEIAEKLGIKYGQAYSFYKNHHLERCYARPSRHPRTRRNSDTPVLMANVAAAYKFYLEANLTLAEVGELFGGITRERVRQVFKMNGLKSRPAGSVRKYDHCEKGHLLVQGEYSWTCSTCREERKKKRERGLHLKTHCIHGHEMTPENTLHFLLKGGPKEGRRCKTCAYECNRNWQKKKTLKL